MWALFVLTCDRIPVASALLFPSAQYCSLHHRKLEFDSESPEMLALLSVQRAGV